MHESEIQLPQLLVSVRSVQEARSAIAGGCAIVDVKEPNNGSLGRASLQTIRDICETCSAREVPSSAALGELAEWIESSETSAEELDANRLPTQLRYAKVGLAGLKDQTSWQSDWLQFLRKAKPKSSPRWIAVAYADDENAHSPSVTEILDVVTSAEAGLFAGLLIDTFDKSSGNLLECMDCDSLLTIRQRLSELDLLLALAGNLDRSMLCGLTEIAPDVLAIRGAACADSNRRSSISEQRVAEFKREIDTTFRRTLA
jgi:uncharacterized protein (UPF0264 family)